MSKPLSLVALAPNRQVQPDLPGFSLNFVMKSTYSSPPVFVTVEKAE